MKDKPQAAVPGVEGREGWRIREEILKKIRHRVGLERQARENPAMQAFLLGLEAAELFQQPRTEQVRAALANNFAQARKVGVVIDIIL